MESLHCCLALFLLYCVYLLRADIGDIFDYWQMKQSST
jgi:hypothetical protein